MKARAAAIPIGLLCLLPATSLSQTTPQTPRPVPTFKSGVDLVVLDVSVLDGQRHPVRDLTAEDFTILEDGKPQKIANFSAVDMQDVEPPPPAASWIREIAPDVRTNDDGDGPRLVLIVMDDSTPMDAVDVLHVKGYGRRIIDNLAPRDLAAVVFTLDQRRGQNYTHDRQLLRAAVDRFGAGGLVMSTEGSRRSYKDFDPTAMAMYASTLGTLQGIVKDLAEAPQRRKILFFVSVGLPLGGDDAAPRPNISNGDDSSGAVSQLLRRLPSLFADAGQANVNVYCVDPGGLRIDPGTKNIDFLKTVSARTGGLATVDTSDPGPGIAQAFSENASFYILGYAPSNVRREGRLRKIEVRVNRPNVTVRTRDGYVEPEAPRSDRKADSPSPLLAAVSGILPKSDLALQATAAPFAAPGRSTAALAVAVRVRHVMPARESRVVASADLVANAYDAENGSLKASGRFNARVTLAPGSEDVVEYEVASSLALPPGRYQLRIGAVSSVAGSTGSVYCDLDVPDFSRPGVTMSGVVLSTGIGRNGAANAAMASLLPLVPTVRREFAADEVVTAFARVYATREKNAAASAAVTARITDEQGGIVFTEAKTLLVTDFVKDGSVDYRLGLPLSSLEAGRYVLTLEATGDKTTVRRDVLFTVR